MSRVTHDTGRQIALSRQWFARWGAMPTSTSMRGPEGTGQRDRHPLPSVHPLAIPGIQEDLPSSMNSPRLTRKPVVGVGMGPTPARLSGAVSEILGALPVVFGHAAVALPTGGLSVPRGWTSISLPALPRRLRSDRAETVRMESRDGAGL